MNGMQAIVTIREEVNPLLIIASSSAAAAHHHQFSGLTTRGARSLLRMSALAFNQDSSYGFDELDLVQAFQTPVILFELLKCFFDGAGVENCDSQRVDDQNWAADGQ